MKPQTVQKISSLLKGIPEKKVRTLIDFIDFLKWSDETFTKEEDQIIHDGSRESKEGKGVDWRDVRKDV